MPSPDAILESQIRNEFRRSQFLSRRRARLLPCSEPPLNAPSLIRLPCRQRHRILHHLQCDRALKLSRHLSFYAHRWARIHLPYSNVSVATESARASERPQLLNNPPTKLLSGLNFLFVSAGLRGCASELLLLSINQSIQPILSARPLMLRKGMRSSFKVQHPTPPPPALSVLRSLQAEVRTVTLHHLPLRQL